MKIIHLPKQILIACLIILFGSLLHAQSGYESYQEAKQLYESKNLDEAYEKIFKASTQLEDYPKQMTNDEAHEFFELFENLSYNLGKMSEVDEVYVKAIQYGSFIQSDQLQCHYTLMRGNYYRIKNKWQKAIGILKDALKYECIQSDYIQIHAILGKSYAQVDFDSILYYSMSVLPLAEQNKDTANLMLLYNNLVAYHKNSNRKAQAFDYEKKSLEYEGKYPVMQVGSNLSMAGLLTSMNNLSLAEDYINQAEKLYTNKNDLRTLAQINYYKARLEYARKNYPEALKYIDLAYEYFLEKGYNNQIAASLSDRAIFAKANNNIDLYEKSIKLVEEHLPKVNSISFKYGATSPVAKYYLENDNPKRAKELMDDLDLKLDEIDWVNRDDYLEIKAQIAKSEKNYLKSLGYFEQLNDYKDSMQRANVTNQILLSEQQYDREKKKNEINNLTVEAQIANANLEKSYWIIAISLLSLGLLSFFFFKLKSKNKKISEQQQRLNSALNDKDILLREIHHRVKNNLQVVSSLLNLQSNYISDNAALEAINEGKNRVSSMALIHQNLYQEENLTGINCKEYFEDLIESLFDSYNIKEGSITLNKEISDLNLDVETMVPLGLIVNELISNALKHAFTENDSKGKISFYLGQKNEKLILKVEDNGKGMTPENFLNSKSFGNKLIHAFKQKLGAEIDIEDIDGTRFTLTIHKYKLAA